MSTSNRVANFNATVRNLNSILQSTSALTPWVRIVIGGFEINTGLKSNDYFVSLENVKSGTGQANTFTIGLAFVPKLGPGLTSSAQDANYIDKVITQSNRRITIQYGYSGLNVNLISPEYTGLILDYSVEVQSGMLLYTLTGYSGLVAYSDKKYNFVRVEGNNIDPLDVAKKAFEKTICDDEELYDYSVEYEEGVEGTAVPISGSSSSTGSTEGTANSSTSEKSTDNTLNYIEAMSDATVFEYVDSVLKLAKYEKDVQADKEQEEASEDQDSEDSQAAKSNLILKRSTYYYYISDADKTIYIGRVDPSNARAESQGDIFTFDWMSREGNLVLDFQTQFKGSVLLAYTANTYGAQDQYEAIGYDGEVVQGSSMNGQAPVAGGSAKQDATTNELTWSEATQYSYKATLTTVGLPCEIPINTYVRIVPLIYGVPHHSEGYYMMTKSTDTINSSGFTTSIEMIKMNDESVLSFKDSVTNSAGDNTEIDLNDPSYGGGSSSSTNNNQGASNQPNNDNNPSNSKPGTGWADREDANADRHSFGVY